MTQVDSIDYPHQQSKTIHRIGPRDGWKNKKPVGARPTGWVQHDIPVSARWPRVAQMSYLIVTFT